MISTCIIGGQLEDDDEPRLYLLYPEGNWIEVRSGTPYVIIGESRYGKPILDRVWSHDQPLRNALRDGLIAFDATVTSASDVDPPVDAVHYLANSYQMNERRFEAQELRPLRDFWADRMRDSVDAATHLVDPLIEQIRGLPTRTGSRHPDPPSIALSATKIKTSRTTPHLRDSSLACFRSSGNELVRCGR